MSAGFQIRMEPGKQPDTSGIPVQDASENMLDTNHDDQETSD